MAIIRKFVLEEAIFYASIGLAVVPCHQPLQERRCSCRKAEKCQSPGKHPRINRWQANASTDETVIADWFEKWPDSNVAVRLGKSSNLIDIEYDTERGKLMADKLLKGIQTPVFESDRSRHYLFRFPDSIISSAAVFEVEDLEVRCGGIQNAALSVFPPSRHASGKKYRWLDGFSLRDVDVASLPQKVLELINTKSRIKLPDLPKVKRTGGQSDFTMSGEHETLARHPGERMGFRNGKLCELVGRHISTKGATTELVGEAIDWGNRCNPPLPEDEILRTVIHLVEKDRGFCRNGSAKPNSGKVKRTSQIQFRIIDTIESREIEWLWQDRIALGKLTLLAGEPGLGKTFAAIDVAATVSNGSSFSDGTTAVNGEVAILTAEDGAGDTIRPRLEAAGADLERVHWIDGVTDGAETFWIALNKNLKELEAYFEEHPSLRLIILDPISAFLGDKIDSHNNSHVRAVLGPLSDLLDRHRVAMLGITHLAKNEARAVHRVIGSIAFVAAARAAWLITKDEDDERRLMLPIKNNLAHCHGLAFRIQDGKCEWETDPVLISSDEIEFDSPTPRDEAKRWLEGVLVDGSLPAKEILKRAKDDGISDKTLRRAKTELNVKSRKKGSAWVWSLPTIQGKHERNEGGENEYVV